MKKKEIFYPESRFGNFTDIDAIITFYIRVNALLKPTDIVLDVGCGRGTANQDAIQIRRNLRIIKGKVEKVIGIDIDKNAEINADIDEFRLIQGETWPIDKESIDLIVSNSVLEHVKNPEIFFSEAHRVLKNGGYICLCTPNLWSYVALFARLIPDRYHARILRFAQGDRREEDVFPTLYRCNTVSKIKRMMKKHGFHNVVYGYEGEPAYLAFSSIVYLVGVVHQKISPGYFKDVIFAFGKRISN